MRTELGKHNAGTRSEVCFYLERDDRTGQLYYIQASPRGEKWHLLDSAVDQPFYREAVEAAQALVRQYANEALAPSKAEATPR